MKFFTPILAMLAMLGAFSIDTFFPSFPAIGDHFGVTQAEMQKTLSFYLMALAIMSLFHGALSDSLGRRPIILTTLSVYTFASIASIFAQSFEILVFCRVLQGLTAGAGFILTQAISRDLYEEGDGAQKLMAKIMMLFSIAPAVAPILGGYLQIWFGWQGVFAFLAVYGASVLTLAAFFLPETLPKEKRHDFHPVTLISQYAKIFRAPQFCLIALSSALCFGALCVYVTCAPDFILNILHLQPTQFGWLFIPVITGLLIGSALTHRMAGKVSHAKIIRTSYMVMFAAAAVNLTYNYFFVPTVPWAVLPLTVYMAASSSVNPVLAIKALDHLPYNRGLASSVLSFMTLVMFAGVSAFVAPLVMGSGFKIASVMFGLFILNAIILYFAMKGEREA